MGVAVNVTDEPEHSGFEPLVNAMATDGVNDEFTTIVIPALVAVKGLAQAELDVITQVTTSPFVKLEVVNVAEFVPAFTPFTFH